MACHTQSLHGIIDSVPQVPGLIPALGRECQLASIA